MIKIKHLITSNHDGLQHKKIQDVLGEKFISDWNDRTNNTDYLVLKLIIKITNEY